MHEEEIKTESVPGEGRGQLSLRDKMDDRKWRKETKNRSDSDLLVALQQ